MAPNYRIYGITFCSSYPFTYNMLPSGEAPLFEFIYGGCQKDYVPKGTSLSSRESEDGLISLYRSPGHDTLVFKDIAAFECGEDRIWGCMLCDYDQFLLEICFIGNVLSYWLERRGTMMIHASSVMIDGGAVAFMAESARGKTTTAAALLATGYPLVTDDILPLNIRDNRVIASPGFPQMKLLPSQLELFKLHAEDFDRIHPDFEKRRIPIGKAAGSFHEEDLPLSCIYLLDESETGEPYSSPVPPSEALISLIRNSFVAQLIDSADRSRERLERMGTVIKGTRVRRLHIPRGYDKLSALVEFIVKENSKGEGR